MKCIDANTLTTISGGDIAANITTTTAVTAGSSLGAIAGTVLGGPIGSAVGASIGAGLGTAVGEYSHDIAKAIVENEDIRKGMLVTDLLLKSIFNA